MNKLTCLLAILKTINLNQTSMNSIRKIPLILMITSLFFACNTEKKSDASESPVIAEKIAINLPYVPGYSSSFEIGNPEYATMIVQGSWKDWEDNRLDNMVNWVEDTITAYHSNTEVVHGVDSLMARWKRARAAYTEVKPSLDAVVPLYSTDRMENWVLVWATEIDTHKDGTIDTVSLMETWRINKNGKADRLYQYDRAKRKK
jgi:hypothetical protein